MLKIAELSRAKEALQEKTIRALEEAGVKLDSVSGKSDRVKIVFAGQYSAGKSSIIKMLTGDETVATGAEITTQETKAYEWNGLEIVDTPGVHTTLRPDHDEISYKAIAAADILVFVITNELFDSYMAEHFRRLAASRADWTAGSSNPISVPIIAMTTKSSTSVKARISRLELCFMRVGGKKVN